MNEKRNPVAWLFWLTFLTVWVVQIVLIILRATKLITCNWLIVFLPIIGFCAGLFILMLSIVLFSGGDDD